MLLSAKKNVQLAIWQGCWRNPEGSAGSLLKNATASTGIEVTKSLEKWSTFVVNVMDACESTPSRSSRAYRIVMMSGDPDETARMCTQQSEIGLPQQ